MNNLSDCKISQQFYYLKNNYLFNSMRTVYSFSHNSNIVLSIHAVFLGCLEHFLLVAPAKNSMTTFNDYPKSHVTIYNFETGR